VRFTTKRENFPESVENEIQHLHKKLAFYTQKRRAKLNLKRAYKFERICQRIKQQLRDLGEVNI